MTSRSWLYALLAVPGLVVPWLFIGRYLAAGGDALDIAGILALAFANPISSSFTSDLFLTFIVFAAWSVLEARRVGMAHGWLFPVVALMIGLAFAFPLFLLMRERRLEAGRTV